MKEYENSDPTVNTSAISTKQSVEVCATSPLTLDLSIESLTSGGDKNRRTFFSDAALDENGPMQIRLDTTHDHLRTEYIMSPFKGILQGDTG